MNPLTQVKNLQKINATEARLGISEDASWHSKYKHSAYVYAGGLEFSLTEGDIVAVFAQYGEVVDVQLVRDKATGKSKGFAFVAYEDQRSTNLAVDNLNGAMVAGRLIKVDHVERYKKLEEEDEEEVQRKREERGVCRAFQRGECARGDSCRFSHNEKRAANTGWGAEDNKWGHNNYDGPRKNGNKSGPLNRVPEPRGREDLSGRNKFRTGMERRSLEEDKRMSRRRGEEEDKLERRSRDEYDGRDEKRPRRHYENDKLSSRSREDYDMRDERRSRRHDDYDKEREYHSRRDDRRPRREGDDEIELKPESGEDKRPRGGGTDLAIETKFTEDQVRKNYDKREDSKSRRRDDDVEAYDKKGDRDQMKEKRPRPNDDEEEPMSRASRDGRDGERSRRHHDYEVSPKSTEISQDRLI